MVNFMCGVLFLAFVGHTEEVKDKDEAYSLNNFVANLLTHEKCMDALGCFSAGAPFFNISERPLSLLPDDREQIDTKFILYTRELPSTPMNFSNMDSSIDNLKLSDFNPMINTKFIVPGFISKVSPHWQMPLKDAFLRYEPCNVFFVDWSGGDGPLYQQAVANTRVVGAEIALFIKHLQKHTGIKPKSVHIVGHSLGSHIAGYAGKRLRHLGRISALDPAGSYFTNMDPIVRLDRSDALFVDAIHTNAAPTIYQGFGLTESIAHFDFFPNGGHTQPGCLDMNGLGVPEYLRNPKIEHDGPKYLMCNHVRSIDFFTSSILHSTCVLEGVQADTWDDFLKGKSGPLRVPMGIHAAQFASNIRKNHSINFYLNTTDTEPYCKLDKFHEIKNTQKVQNTQGLRDQIVPGKVKAVQNVIWGGQFRSTFSTNRKNLASSKKSKGLQMTAGESGQSRLVPMVTDGTDQAEELREQCIEDLGCYKGVESPVPDKAMERITIGTQFRWWATGAQKARVITNQEFEVSEFDSGLKVKFIIHGWMAGEAEWALTMKDAFMRQEQCNVFIVDWTKGAEDWYYFKSVANTLVVGAETGHFIVQLVEATGLKVEDIHIIGHSLGAHVAGFAGKWVKSRLEKPLGRITGLDPAGPEFIDSIPGKRLDKEDAAFIDVIHTNGALAAELGVGLLEAVGNFDFYPNGGERQPGCKAESENSRFWWSDVQNMLETYICSHSRAIYLFIESIESDSCKFLADQCTSWEEYQEGKCPSGNEGTLTVQMGYHADEYKQYIDEEEHKSFFLDTNGEPAYCKRQ